MVQLVEQTSMDLQFSGSISGSFWPEVGQWTLDCVLLKNISAKCLILNRLKSIIEMTII